MLVSNAAGQPPGVPPVASPSLPDAAAGRPSSPLARPAGAPGPRRAQQPFAVGEANMPPRAGSIPDGRRTQDTRPPDRLTAAEPAAVLALLARQNCAPVLKELRLTSTDPTPKDMRLSGLRFNHCEFDWNHFGAAEMTDCSFENCVFKNTSFMNASMRNCRFKSCELAEAMWVNACMHDVAFCDCTFIRASFEDAKLTSCEFHGATMCATHFLGADVEDCRMRNCSVQDTAFFGTQARFDLDAATRKTLRTTRPATAMLVFPEHRGNSGPRAEQKVSDAAGCSLLRIAAQPSRVGGQDVDREVSNFLEAQSARPGDARPLAQRLLAAILERPDDFPGSARILGKAAALAAGVDSLVLPGGEDVSPHLYGEAPAPQTSWQGDYRRSLLELGLIRESLNKGIPLMAICRGFQMLGIHFGAKLHQHVGKQYAVQVLEHEGPPRQEQGLFGPSLDRLRSAVFFHQAIWSGADLFPMQPALTSTLSCPDGATWRAELALEPAVSMVPMMGMQFHAEYYQQRTPRRNAESITNEDLAAMVHANGWDAAGGAPPTTDQVITSEAMDYMSPGNLTVWKIFSDAAHAHWHKSAIGQDDLVRARAALKPAGAVD